MTIQKSIVKKYRKEIWSKFVRAVKDFKLIEEGDKIAVCISGGKDSFLLAKCMEELKRHGQFPFELTFILMDPGYDEKHMALILENIKKFELDVHIFKTDIFEVSDKHSKGNACYLCARMRRGHLYNEAKKLGCNKIALGHHADDVVETILLNVFYNGSFKTMMPKIESTNFEGMKLIRPLYYVQEKDIIRFKEYNELEFLDCACSVTKKKEDSKRAYLKNLIKELEKENPNLKHCIYKSSENVNVDAILGMVKDNKKTLFYDE